jgi:hypothetical protein
VCGLGSSIIAARERCFDAHAGRFERARIAAREDDFSMSSRRSRRWVACITLLAGLLPRSAPAEGLRLDAEQIVEVSVSEEEAHSARSLVLRPSRVPLGGRAAGGVSAAQQVFLDFEGGAPSFDVVAENLDGTSRVLATLPSHVYTPDERAAIEAFVAADVRSFGISVSSSPPAEGAFSTLTFNAPLPIRLVAVAGGGFRVSGSFGDSDSIDHRNQNPADGAVIAAHLWEFFVATDPTGRSFEAASGLVIDAEHPLAARLSEAVVRQSANTAAHELGHLLGLRHHDGFGPPGDGLPSNGAPSPLAFVPPFSGPFAADDTTLHLMSTGSTGATPRVRASVDQFFSERSALKVVLPGLLGPTAEVDAPGVSLEPALLSVPSPLPEGEGAGLAVQALLVDASIASEGEVDEFRFDGVAGEVWTVDLVSTVDPSFAAPVVTDVRLLLERPDGARSLIAYNAQIFEGNDPLLLDVELPSDGTYIVQVDAPDTAFIDSDGDGFRDDPISLEENGIGELRTGDYELLLYSIAR